MKRFKPLFAVALVGMMCLTGCGEKEENVVVQEEVAEEEISAEEPAQDLDVQEEAVEEETAVEEEPKAEEEVEAEEEPAGEEVLPEEAPEQGEAEVKDVYIDDIYKDILEKYYTALSEEWNEGQYYENGMCAMMSFYYGESPLDNLGYALMDLDFDGQKELLLGAMLKEEKYPIIMEIYTVTDGKAVHLATSDYRNTYHLEWLEEGAYLIANEGSSSAVQFGYHYYIVQDGGLKLIQAVIHDAAANEENPWFIAEDNDWDTSNDEPDTDGVAQAIIDANCAVYMQPEYEPFSTLENRF